MNTDRLHSRLLARFPSMRSRACYLGPKGLLGASGGSIELLFVENMKTTLATLLLAVVCCTGCDKREDKAPMNSYDTGVVLKVSVMQSGKLLADGTEISLAGLDSRMAELKTQRGIVWYYREVGQGEPPPVAMEVMKLVVKHSLPISMSSKPDFSDAIDQQGLSRPRK